MESFGFITSNNVPITEWSESTHRTTVEQFAATGYRVILSYFSSLKEAAALEARWELFTKARLDQDSVACAARSTEDVLK